MICQALMIFFLFCPFELICYKHLIPATLTQSWVMCSLSFACYMTFNFIYCSSFLVFFSQSGWFTLSHWSPSAADLFHCPVVNHMYPPMNRPNYEERYWKCCSYWCPGSHLSLPSSHNQPVWVASAAPVIPDWFPNCKTLPIVLCRGCDPRSPQQNFVALHHLSHYATWFTSYSHVTTILLFLDALMLSCFESCSWSWRVEYVSS